MAEALGEDEKAFFNALVKVAAAPAMKNNEDVQIFIGNDEKSRIFIKRHETFHRRYNTEQFEGMKSFP